MTENRMAYIYKIDTSTGYTVHNWRLYSQGKVESIREILLGTVDNRDGYGSLDACKRVAEQCELLLQKGYTHAFLTGWDCCHINLRIQHYRTVDSVEQWCNPRWEQWADEIQKWEANTKFAKSLRIPIKDDTGPDVVFKRLKARNAVRLVDLHVASYIVVDPESQAYSKAG